MNIINKVTGQLAHITTYDPVTGDVTGFTPIGNIVLGPVGNITITGGAPGEVLATDGAGNLSFVPGGGATYGDANVSVYLDGNIASDIVPATSTQSLGSLAYPWNELYLSGNTLYIAGVPLSIGANSELVFNGVPLVTTTGTETIETTGNIIGANITATSAITADGNITANTGYFFVGDGGFLSNVGGGGSYGNADVEILLGSGNIDSNIITTGNVLAAALYVGNANSVTPGTPFFTSNSQGTVFGLVDQAGIEVIAGTALTLVSDQGITLDALSNTNIILGGVGTNAVMVLSNVVSSNIIATTSNVIADYFIGDGSLLTGLPAGYSNADVANYLPTYTGNLGAGNILLVGTTSLIEGAGTIAVLPSAGNTVDLGTTRLLGDMTPVNAMGGNIGTAGLPFFSGQFVNLVSDTITSTGEITAAHLIGEGGNLSNITGANVVGDVANAAFATTSGSADSVAGANVSGQVANALIAGTVYDPTQPAITTVGTLVGLTVSGETIVGGNLVTDNILGNTSGITVTAVGTDQNITLVPTGTGYIDVSGAAVKNLLDPVAAQDAATKAYVDSVAEGLTVQDACVATTDDDLATITGDTVVYDNGVDGVGATLTLSTALVTLDGVALANGDRVLIKNELNSAENGIYTWATGGTVLTRATNYDTITEIGGGDFVFITGGLIYGNSGWVQVDNITAIGTDPIQFTQFSGAASYTAGIGLTLTGTQFSITNTAVTAGTYGNASTVVTMAVNAQGQLTNVTQQAVVANAETLAGTALNATVLGSSLTSVGTLTNLTVTGNVTAGFLYGDGSNITGLPAGYSNADVSTYLASGTDTAGYVTTGNVTAGFLIGDGAEISNIAGVNVTGQVANALVSGTVYTAAQPNITSVGELTDLSVDSANTISIYGGNSTSIVLDSANGYVSINQNANIDIFGNITTSGDITAFNMYAANMIADVMGNVTTVLFGDGANITGLPAGYSNADVSTYLASGTDTAGIVTTGDISANIITATTFTGEGGNIANIQGGNVQGTVASALEAGIVTTAAQPNITSVGTLTGLTVAGVSDLGVVGNVIITGGSAGQVLSTDGAGNLSFISTAGAPSNITNGTSNVDIATSGGNVTMAVAGEQVFELTGNSVSLGYQSGSLGSGSQGIDAVAIGMRAGQIDQLGGAIAIGNGAGQDTQLANSIAIGTGAGYNLQGQQAIAIGTAAGSGDPAAFPPIPRNAQGSNAIAIGSSAGVNYQGANSVAIGTQAGANRIGANSVAVGAFAGAGEQAANSIVINATGANLDALNSGLYVAPVRNDTGNTTNVVYYNDTTKEVTYGPGATPYGNAEVAAYLPTYTGNLGNVDSIGTTGNIDTLGDINVSVGNITIGGDVVATGNVTGDYIIGNGSSLSSLTGANVTGQVANALVAGTVYTAAQPAITSVGTLTTLTVSGNATVSGNLITDSVVSNTGTLTLSASGTNQNVTLVPTGTGAVDVSSRRIIDLALPVDATDAATKQYVDSFAEGLQVKAAVAAATPASLSTLTGDTVTYDNGVDGVGATLTLDTALTVLDGVTLVDGARILVLDEATPANNGIYTWATGGTVLTRATDFDTPTDISAGSFVFVSGGTLYAGTGWVEVDTIAAVGTDPIDFTQFSGTGSYTAGAGLSLNGTEFSVANTTVTAGTYGNASEVLTVAVNSRGQLTAVSQQAVVANATTLSGTALNSTVVTSSLTSVGTLTGLTVGGDTDLGPVANVTITGGTSGQLLSTDGSGNLAWATPALIANGTTNINIATSGGNITAAVAGNSAMILDTNTSIAIGIGASRNTSKTGAVVVGANAGSGSIGFNSIAIGVQAAEVSSGDRSVAMGFAAGKTNQGDSAVALGPTSGFENQGQAAVAVGQGAGQFSQGTKAVAVGEDTALYNQGQYSIALGASSGNNIGQGAIVIGSGVNGAAANAQAANSIVINATGTPVTANAVGIYVAPVRNDTGNVTNTVYYNTTTKEVTYGPGVAGYGDSNVVTLLGAFGSNSISTTGNIVAATIGNASTVLFGNGANITGLPAGYSNADVSLYLADGSDTAGFATAGDVAANNIVASTGLSSLGDGFYLGNISTQANLSVSGVSNLNAVGNVIITGGSAGQVLSTNGSGNLSWTTIATYGNAEVSTYLASNANVVVTTTGNITTTANVSANNLSVTANIASGNNITAVGNISANGNIIVNGTIGTGNISGANNISGLTVLASNAILVGTTVTTLPNTVARFGSNANSYTQITFQNLSTGADATSDIVLTTDNGNDTVNFADFGIINSAYDPNTPTNSLGNVVFAGDAYLYAQGNTGNTSQSGGNLVLGATVDTKNVKIFAGGNSNSFVTATFTSTAANIKALNVAGVSNLNAVGNVKITGGTSGQVLRTDGAGNLSFITVAGGAVTSIVNGNSNVAVAANANVTMAVTGVSAFKLSANAVAVGSNAGLTTQGANSVAVGFEAGQTSQGIGAVAIGRNAGGTTQADSAVAIGPGAGQLSQSTTAVAIGSGAGLDTQGQIAVAIGFNAGGTAQGASAIAIGQNAGRSNQSANSIAIGNGTGNNIGLNSIAIGRNIANAQVANSVAINGSGTAITVSNSGLYAAPVRNDTGNVTNAVYYNTTTKEVTYGPAGGGGGSYGDSNVVTLLSAYGSNTVTTTGNITAGNFVFTGNITKTSGYTIQLNPLNFVVTVNSAAVVTIDPDSDTGYVALGTTTVGAGAQTIAIGTSSQSQAGGAGAVSIGYNSSTFSAGAKSIAIGQFAGSGSFAGTKLGANSIVIGYGSANGGSAANVIVLNATGANFTPSTSQASSFYVNPVRNDTGNTTNVMYYNTTTKEVTYGPAGGGGSYGDSNVVTLLGAYGSNTITGTGNITTSGFVNAGNITSGNATDFVTLRYSGANTVSLSTTRSGFASVNQMTLNQNGTVVGYNAGAGGAGTNSVVIGGGAAAAANSVSVGTEAATFTPGVNSVAIGYQAGQGVMIGAKLGANSVVIGTLAAAAGSANNVIILNATGANFTPLTSQASSFYVNPVRNDTGNVTNVVYYNTTTKEVTYGPAGGGGGSTTIDRSVITGNVTLALAQAGTFLYSTTTTAQTATIPTNASVAFAIGTTINVVLNGSGSVQLIPASGVSLYLAGNSTSASRTLSPYGIATLLQVDTDVWFVNGTGVN